MFAAVACPAPRVCASTPRAAPKAGVRSVRPVIKLRAKDDMKPADEVDILHEQRDVLKDAVNSSSDLKEARRKLYGNEESDKMKVMDGAAEKGESVLDKVSGRVHKSEGHNPYPTSPQPGSRTDREGPDARKAGKANPPNM